MATKTFEELKQLAIQIRDEKTNKQNTATRVGTAMLEHINKLEQDYYDKTTINNRTSEYNVSINHPTSGISSSNKYDLSSAIAQVPAELRTAGLKVSFLNSAGKPESWKYQGGSWAVASFIQESSGGNKILTWVTDAATTRKQVAVNERKGGMQVSYTPDGKNWVNEQYIGEYTMDSEWEKDENWVNIPSHDQLLELEEPLLINSDIQHTLLKGKFIDNDGNITVGTSFNIKLYDISTITETLDIYAYISAGNYTQYAFYDEKGTSASNLIGVIGDYPKGAVDTVYKNVAIPERAKQLALVFNANGTPKNRGFCINSSKEFIKDFSEEDETSPKYIKNIPDKVKSKVADYLMQDANACNYYITHLVKDKNYTTDIPVEKGDTIYVRTDGHGSFYRLQKLGEGKEILESISNDAGKLKLHTYVIDDERVKYIRSYINVGTVGSKYGCFLYIKRTSNNDALKILEKISYFSHTSFTHSVVTDKDKNSWYLQYINKEMNGELDFSSMKYVGFINYSNFIIPNSISDDVKFMIKIRLKLISSSDSQSVVLSPYASQSDLKSTEFNVCLLYTSPSPRD